ncbi:FAD-dependent oxidoreductase [Pseudomonas aeruginosa]|uniref:FAD-dependent oxidoreductase n=1 Tax=Pseudomonas aeruginosa TaxID=287 RepID=UPI001CA9DDB4|nr:FAD-dependent oxidoreductase [Pseudomonas aeruginosa]
MRGGFPAAHGAPRGATRFRGATATSDRQHLGTFGLRQTPTDEALKASGRLRQKCCGPGDMQPVAHWAGLRPGSPEGTTNWSWPCFDGIWLNTGHYRNGVVLAPASCRLLAELIAGGNRSSTRPLRPAGRL